MLIYILSLAGVCEEVGKNNGWQARQEYTWFYMIFPICIYFLK